MSSLARLGRYLIELENKKPGVKIVFGKHSYGPQPKIAGYMPWLPYLMSGSRIGKYCSFGSNITFAFLGKHDYDLVTTYPFVEFYKKWQTDTPANPYYNKGVIDASKIPAAPIIINNDVWIGNGTTIRQGVTVRNGAVIAMDSLVVKDVPPYAIVGGNPAKIIKYRFSPEQILDLLRISWWDWPDDKVKRMLPFMLSHDIDNFIKVAKNL